MAIVHPDPRRFADGSWSIMHTLLALERAFLSALAGFPLVGEGLDQLTYLCLQCVEPARGNSCLGFASF